MKILHIFGPKDGPESVEGLWAVEYEDASENALVQLFDFWQDPELMVRFCVENIDDIQRKFGDDVTPEEAADELMDEADEMLMFLMSLAKRETSDTLQSLFKPLNDLETDLTVLQLSKASSKTKLRKDPKLRIYAVRINENTYVVTGGAIKLTNQMQDRPHTIEELQRLKTVKDWLNREGVSYPEDLTDVL
jgi:hypothetical protein